MHSLCSGGASAAAKAGVPGRLFQQHRRWKSELAKDNYVEDSEENRLSVSRRIGTLSVSLSYRLCVIYLGSPVRWSHWPFFTTLECGFN